MSANTPRHIRLCRSARRRCATPVLTLEGVWFKRAGFGIGDQVEFCALKEGDKRRSILKATELAASPIPAFPQGEGVAKSTRSAPEQKTNKANHTAILAKIFDSFKNGMHLAARPKEYLTGRGLDYALLEAGYNSGQFHHRGNLSGSETQACVEAGLLIPYSGHIGKANQKKRRSEA